MSFYRKDGCSGNGYKCDNCGHIWVNHIAPGSQCPEVTMATVNDQLEGMVARWLETYARLLEEDKALPMLPKTDVSWQGFLHDARKLLLLLRHPSQGIDAQIPRATASDGKPIEPSARWSILRKFIIDTITDIDNATTGLGHEPTWWLEMMEIARQCRKIR
jgi:hypothetical protein